MTETKGKTNVRPAIFVPDFSTLQPKMQDKFRVKIEEFTYGKLTPPTISEVQEEINDKPASKIPEKVEPMMETQELVEEKPQEKGKKHQVFEDDDEGEIEENELKPNPKLVNEFITLLTSTPASKMITKTFKEEEAETTEEILMEDNTVESVEPLKNLNPDENSVEIVDQIEAVQNDENTIEEVEVEVEPEVNQELRSLIRRLAVFPHVLQRPNCEAVINGDTKIIKVLSKRGDNIRIQSAEGTETVNIKEIEELKVLIDNN